MQSIEEVCDSGDVKTLVMSSLRLEYVGPTIRLYYGGHKVEAPPTVQLWWGDELIDEVELGGLDSPTEVLG